MTNGARDSTLDTLLTLVNNLQKQRDEKAEQLKTIDSDLEAVKRTVSLLLEETLSKLDTTLKDITKTIRGLTHKNALVAMAKSNKGTIKVSDAKRGLIAAGLVKGNPKYISGHVYNLLKDDARFTWIAPGTFKLVHEGQPIADIKKPDYYLCPNGTKHDWEYSRERQEYTCRFCHFQVDKPTLKAQTDHKQLMALLT